MVTSGTASGIDLSDSWGSTLAAVFVSLVFYGVSILQTFLYYERYTEDSIILKLLVAWVFVLDTLHTLLISAGVWQYFVVHFADDDFLAYTHAPLLISIVVTSAVSTSVQSFFIYRIWFMMRSRFRWLFPVVLFPFVVAQLVLGTFYTVVAMAFQTSVSAVRGPFLLYDTRSKVANALNGVATAVDITITISLCALLAMGRTGYADTDQMLRRLIFISVNTGLSSALFAFLSVLLVRVDTLLIQQSSPTEIHSFSCWQLVIYPTHLIFTALYYPLCTVYCNTLLANLNARSFVRGGTETRQLNRLSSLVWRQSITVHADAEADTEANTDSGSERTEVLGGICMARMEPLPMVNV
ncbi:hypothetical protein JVT61DRAFT_8324 [Boletus reticuloceps]|uniref:DUF6534 domain-containing protein n=1 Tax=Boletus reticuloceps TaxID=495285 RepID=A0A8I2YYX1_9AGAM|nr:hypothetical protein JVT61DRAFT_8324 [Boletus reticuloceps]